MINQVINSSVVVSLFRFSFRMLRDVLLMIKDVYLSSRIYLILCRICDTLVIYFRHSFLEGSSRIGQFNSSIWEDSFIVQHFIRLKERINRKINVYKSTSFTQVITRSAKRIFNISPLRIFGIIVLSAVITNIFLVIFLEREIMFFGLVIRGIFLLMGVLFIFCRTDLRVFKKNSIILRKMGLV